jgi:hypothetical protein
MIDPQSGRALEMLGHAIEYLADEFALECMERGEIAQATGHARVMAIELLKERNREIYLRCPIVPTFGERVRSFLRLENA